jgi:hypothetical protein
MKANKKPHRHLILLQEPLYTKVNAPQFSSVTAIKRS